MAFYICNLTERCGEFEFETKFLSTKDNEEHFLSTWRGENTEPDEEGLYWYDCSLIGVSCSVEEISAKHYRVLQNYLTEID